MNYPKGASKQGWKMNDKKKINVRVQKVQLSCKMSFNKWRRKLLCTYYAKILPETEEYKCLFQQTL